MSAFVVNTKHIDALLNWAARQDNLYYFWQKTARYFGREVEDIGNILLKANYASVNYNYSENIKAPDYVFHYHKAQFKPVDIIKACNCLDYQSCEVPNWRDTEACRIIETIKDHAITQLPGYDESPTWDINY